MKRRSAPPTLETTGLGSLLQPHPRPRLVLARAPRRAPCRDPRLPTCRSRSTAPCPLRRAPARRRPQWCRTTTGFASMRDPSRPECRPRPRHPQCRPRQRPPRRSRPRQPSHPPRDWPLRRSSPHHSRPPRRRRRCSHRRRRRRRFRRRHWDLSWDPWPSPCCRRRTRWTFRREGRWRRTVARLLPRPRSLPRQR